MFESLPSLKETIDRYYRENQERLAKKKFGQNFLLNMDIVRRIVRFSGDLSKCSVVEVGPGPGGLTRAILEAHPQHLFAIEMDPRCVDILSDLKEASAGNLDIIEGDALKIMPQSLCEGPIKIIANLPYNVGTALLIQWLHCLDNIQSMTLMFQKEVALRIIAKTGTKDYGRLSVLCQFLCDVTKVFDLPPGAFSPPPKVTSSVVHFVPKVLKDNELALLPILEELTKRAFNQRRKMLRSSLKGYVDESLYEDVGILPTSRAEELKVSDYIALAKLIAMSK